MRFKFSAEADISLFPSSEAHLVSYPIDARDTIPGIKRPKREADLNIIQHGDYLH
jgi:hypothetical protein